MDDQAASPWVRRFAPRVPAGATVLDVAAGRGRHTRLFARAGHPVLAVDVDTDGLRDLAGDPTVMVVRADLEGGAQPIFAPGRFGGVVVTRYLHRPLLPALIEALAPGGVLIYETFAQGQQRFGRPTNPDYLLEPGELLEAVRGRLTVLAYEDLVVDDPRPSRLQRLCARRPDPG